MINHSERRAAWVLTLMLALMVLVFTAGVGTAQPAAEPPSTATETADGDGTSAPAQEVTVTPEAADGAIASRLQNIFEASGWYRGIAVRVEEGIAFLNGQTETTERRRWAGDLARKTQDVVAVVNQIEVTPSLSFDWTPAWREARKIGVQLVQVLPLVLLAIVVLGLASLLTAALARGVFASLKTRVSSPLLRTVIARAVAFPVFLLGLYLVLQVAGLTRLALTVLGGTGVIGIVLGFAFRDIAENFLASLLLSMRNPFEAGDYISVAGHEGIVRNLNTRSTILLTIDGQHVRIPNATVFKSVIINYSSNAHRRDTCTVGIGYDDHVADARDVIIGVLAASDAVEKKPAPQVLVAALGAATVQLDVHYWFDGREHSPPKLKSALLSRMKQALTDAGVSMPDEAREVIFPKGVPVIQAPELPSETRGVPAPKSNGSPASVKRPGVPGDPSKSNGVRRQSQKQRAPARDGQSRPEEDTRNDDIDAVRSIENDTALEREDNLLRA